MSVDHKTGLQLRSLIKKGGELELSLAEIATPEPAADEVVVRVEASPINPSDLGLLAGAADMTTAKASGTKDSPVITAKVPEAAMSAMAGRLDESMPAGNEGAGVAVKDGIGLVNIVRSQGQADILRTIGAKYVVDSTSPTFADDLTKALVETGATLAFDAIGGGKLAGQILTCMEIAANKTAKVYSRYGSSVHKQVYIYGALDTRPIELNRAFGMAWGVGGWLLFPFLQKIGPAEGAKLRQRVVAALKTTFASHYTQVVSLQEALQLSNIAIYAKRATGEKFLINPNKAG